MDIEFQNSKGQGPIIRKTASDRFIEFDKASRSIYNKFSPFTGYSIGPSQPFVYVKISDSTFFKNLTKYDSYAAPIGSTARDLKRIGQFLITGNGILYVGKQLFLQKENSFNETRVFNPLSTLKATARPGSLGLIDYPQRHLETSGGLLNFFKDAFLSTIGYQTKDAQKPRIEGTATGENGTPYSVYVGKHGGARAGLLRYNTAIKASSNFDTLWVSNTSGGNGSKGGFLANLGKALVNKLKSLIPSTNPLGAFRGSPGSQWAFRPEYMSGGETGIFFKFWEDKSGYLSVTTRSYPRFYNGRYESSGTVTVRAADFHVYTPLEKTTVGTIPTVEGNLYASITAIQSDTVGLKGNNITDIYAKMLTAPEGTNYSRPQLRGSTERYKTIEDYKGNKYRPYSQIPNGKSQNFESKMQQAAITLAEREFASTQNNDLYNSRGVLNDKSDLYLQGSQSKDIIFFYFYDIINKKYIPFRATITSLNEQHSAEWEDITYLGRADKLFLYKGFSRETSFGFTVYANSAAEMIPMWERINYLVGLTRPSGYTSNAGRQSSFIYPPMIKFRIGDMFVDQPAILYSVTMNVPDDTNWESLRSDSYTYKSDPDKSVPLGYSQGAKTRQLPLKVDISVNLKLLESQKSLVSDDHYGYNGPASIAASSYEYDFI